MKINTSHGSTVGGTASANGQVSREYSPPAPLENVLESEPLKPSLSAEEQNEKERLEAVVVKGWGNFLEVGNALLEISAKKLYRDKFTNFQDYCREHLGLSRSYACNLRDSAEVYSELSSIEDIDVKSLREAHLRELIPVPPAKRVEAWKGAIELAKGKDITAKIVHQAAAQFRTKAKGQKGKPIKKQAATESINLDKALKILARAEQAASSDETVLKVLKELRDCLAGLPKAQK